MIDELISFGLPREVIVAIISALPIVELRAALPVGIKLFDLPWYQALYLAIIGNMLPVPFLLLFLEPLAKGISRTDVGKKLVNLLPKRTGRRTALVEKYKSIGLMTLVSIPVPGSGVWTSAMIACLLGMRWRRALPPIAVGVLVSGLIVTALCLLHWVAAITVGFGLISLAILVLWKA